MKSAFTIDHGNAARVYMHVAVDADGALRTTVTGPQHKEPCGVTLTISTTLPGGKQYNSIRVAGEAFIDVDKNGIAVSAEISLADILGCIQRNDSDLRDNTNNEGKV